MEKYMSSTYSQNLSNPITHAAMLPECMLHPVEGNSWRVCFEKGTFIPLPGEKKQRCVMAWKGGRISAALLPSIWHPSCLPYPMLTISVPSGLIEHVETYVGLLGSGGSLGYSSRVCFHLHSTPCLSPPHGMSSLYPIHPLPTSPHPPAKQ